ncbi:MAG TPA: DUF4350 domain-containing protein [Gammaproteobacteria bacterium]
MSLPSRSWRGLHDLLYLLLLVTLVGLLGWLTERHALRLDWSAGGQHTLSEASRRAAVALRGPLRATAYARPGSPVIARIRELVGRYQQVKPDLELAFVNPDLAPAEVREREIRYEGELLFDHGQRSERLEELSEQALTNLLHRLARGAAHQVRFLAGHGERKPLGQANHDLGQLGSELQRKGLQLEAMNPVLSGGVPEDTALLVVAGPQNGLLPGEDALLGAYLASGGNLLWLGDPGTFDGLESLAGELGVQPVPGTVVAATGSAYGIGDPSFVVLTGYPDHPATRGLADATLLPQASALEAQPTGDWTVRPLLRTDERAWSELGPIDGTLRHDAADGERRGPLDLALAFTRARAAGGEQRVVVVGDGDFLANAYLGNGGNLDLGLRLFNWLVADDALLEVPPRLTSDRALALSRQATLVIGFGFLFVLPIGLLASGLLIRRQRRRR